MFNKYFVRFQVEGVLLSTKINASCCEEAIQLAAKKLEITEFEIVKTRIL